MSGQLKLVDLFHKSNLLWNQENANINGSRHLDPNMVKNFLFLSLANDNDYTIPTLTDGGRINNEFIDPRGQTRPRPELWRQRTWDITVLLDSGHLTNALVSCTSNQYSGSFMVTVIDHAVLDSRNLAIWQATHDKPNGLFSGANFLLSVTDQYRGWLWLTVTDPGLLHSSSWSPGAAYITALQRFYAWPKLCFS